MKLFTWTYFDVNKSMQGAERAPVTSWEGSERIRSLWLVTKEKPTQRKFPSFFFGNRPVPYPENHTFAFVAFSGSGKGPWRPRWSSPGRKQPWKCWLGDNGSSRDAGSPGGATLLLAWQLTSGVGLHLKPAQTTDL